MAKKQIPKVEGILMLDAFQRVFTRQSVPAAAWESLLGTKAPWIGEGENQLPPVDGSRSFQKTVAGGNPMGYIENSFDPQSPTYVGDQVLAEIFLPGIIKWILKRAGLLTQVNKELKKELKVRL